MLDNLEIFLTVENIYLFANWGVLPFWLLIMLAPNDTITKILVHSILIPILLGTAYVYFGYMIFIKDDILEIFNLYLGIDELYAVFSNEKFLLIFWLHFLSISLFTGSWIARDSVRYLIPKFLMILALIVTYFTGPIGLIIYWVIRIFFAKKFSFNE
tara:strand:+ start:165 stop:635 length:471 start_codon:yes stop_codon:yes gene_type:complete